MTLDPVHFSGITGLVRRVRHDIDEEEHRDEANRVWEHYLDPLYDGEDEPVLEPLGDVTRFAVDMMEAGIQPSPFDSVHGIDSGTINPRQFKNGLVLDVAQAAMSVTPSDVDTHRLRTVVTTVHASDDTVIFQPGPGVDEWDKNDAGFWRGRIYRAPTVERDEQSVVHALSLYLAESQHALENHEQVEDCLVLDGPIYPKIVLNWLDQHRELARLPEEDDLTSTAIRNYIELAETFIERDVPLVGFVKNVQSRGLVRALDDKEKLTVPWTDDAGFYTQILERRNRTDDGFERSTDDLTYTNWFVSRLGYDRVVSCLGDRLELALDRDPEDYEVAFFVIYDPRTDVLYKVETPRAFAEDEAVREQITRHVVGEVAANAGPPTSVAKADELARISQTEKQELVPALEDALDSDERVTYDDERWG